MRADNDVVYSPVCPECYKVFRKTNSIPEAELIISEHVLAKHPSTTAGVSISSARQLQIMRARAEKAEDELAKFYKCEDSNGCYDPEGRFHSDADVFVWIPDRPAKDVYHRKGE